MVIAITDSNDCDFAVQFDNADDAEKVKSCMRKGLNAWYCAAHPDSYEGTDFTKEEIEGFYWEGYAEPTQILLDRNGIASKVVDIEVDENYEVTADEVIYA